MKILFVCLGNICRSPAAEAVFLKLAKEAGLSPLEVDSAGTASYHIGARADSRMRAALVEQAYNSTSLARQVRASDFSHYDLIFAMDHDNLRSLRSSCPNEESQAKVHLFLDYCLGRDEGVPDPYYGGKDGFFHVISLVEEASHALIANLTERANR